MSAVIVLLITGTSRRIYVQDKLKEFLCRTFETAAVEVVDDSHKHRNHAGMKQTGGGHFKVLVVSDLFAGMSRIDRHRKVTKSVMEAFPGAIHALSVQAVTPEEMI